MVLKLERLRSIKRKCIDPYGRINTWVKDIVSSKQAHQC